jgi:hypothetical protein
VTTANEVRELGVSVARELAENGVPPEKIKIRYHEQEVRSSGLFGWKKVTVHVPKERSDPLGWQLSERQPMASRLDSGGNTTEAAELWLGVDGELLVARWTEIFDSFTGDEYRVFEESRKASDSELQMPDYKWENINLPPESRSSSSLWEERVWGRQEAISAPYEGVTRQIKGLRSRLS